MYPPILILITDGNPTDDFDQGLQTLMAGKLGRNAKRLAVGIGLDVDQDILRRFIGDKGPAPFTPDRIEEIADYLNLFRTRPMITDDRAGFPPVPKTGISVPNPRPDAPDPLVW